MASKSFLFIACSLLLLENNNVSSYHDPRRSFITKHTVTVTGTISSTTDANDSKTAIHQDHDLINKTLTLRCGSIFAGWNPFGYAITKLGLQFLEEFDGSLDSDVGRFLATFKSGRKRETLLKQQWLEIVRVSKQGQSMRIYRKIDELLAFCVKAGFLS